MADQSSASPYAFDAPGQTVAFDDVDQAAQSNASVQQQFESQRSRRNYIQSIQKGAKGASRTGIQGNG